MRNFMYVVVCLPFISACAALPGINAGATGVRILCGFVDIIIDEADIPKVENAFSGDDSFGKKVCRAFRAFSQEQPPGAATVGSGTKTVLPLPSGETVDLKIMPATVNQPEIQ